MRIGFGDELALHQRGLRELAGQVETAAGLGGGDAFGLVERAGNGGGGGADQEKGHEAGYAVHR